MTTNIECKIISNKDGSATLTITGDDNRIAFNERDNKYFNASKALQKAVSLNRGVELRILTNNLEVYQDVRKIMKCEDSSELQTFQMYALKRLVRKKNRIAEVRLID